MHALDRSSWCSAPLAVVLTTVLAGAGACGRETPEELEPVDIETRAFSEASCANATADFGMAHPQNPAGPYEVSHTSPATYNTCYKGYVVDVFHHNNPTYGHGDNWRKQVTVRWAGPIPITRSACEAISGSAIVYEYDDFALPPGWVYPERQSVTGQWVRIDGTFNVCRVPSMTFTLYPAFKSRVAATMRYSNNTTAAAKITVKTTVFDFN
jgi:hypothetical protein